MPTARRTDRHDWARFSPSVLPAVTRLHAHFTEHAFERHSHDTYSVGVTLGGVQSFHCRGAQHASTAGHVLLFNPDEPHDGQRGGDEGFEYRILYIEPGALQQALGREAGGDGGTQTARYFRRNVVADAPAAREVEAVIEAMGQPQETLRAETLLMRLLAMLLQRHGDPAAALREAAAGMARMERVREMIESLHAQDLSVDALAREVGLSRAHLTRAFTSAQGLPPHLYLNSVRLRHACRLLRLGCSLADTAAATGFADQSHLNRRFKGSFGIAPGAWLRQLTLSGSQL